MLTYCDYIAHLISTYIKPHDMNGLLTNVGPAKYNLDIDGSLCDDTKTIEVTDVNGQRYLVTVERLPMVLEELVDGTHEALKALTVQV